MNRLVASSWERMEKMNGWWQAGGRKIKERQSCRGRGGDPHVGTEGGKGGARCRGRERLRDGRGRDRDTDGERLIGNTEV